MITYRIGGVYIALLHNNKLHARKDQTIAAGFIAYGSTRQDAIKNVLAKANYIHA